MYSRKLLLVGLFVLVAIGFAWRDAPTIGLNFSSITCDKTKTPCGQCFCLGSVEGGFKVGGANLAGNTVSQLVRASEGVIACGTFGNKNAAGGIQVAADNNTRAFSGATAIPNNVKQTSFIGIITADADLQESARENCPNQNWFGLAYAACRADITLDFKDGKNNLRASKGYSCTLDCSALDYVVDPRTGEFSFKPMAYECNENEG